MLGFVFGRANSGKTEYIFERIAEDVRKNAGPVILIVPEQSTFDCERKLVARLGAAGSASVEVTSFTRLADMIFEELGGEYGTPIEESLRIILMSRALDQVRPSLRLYGRHAASAAFVQAVLSALDEMKQTGLCAEEMLSLSRRAQNDTLSAMLHDFAMIDGAYEGLLGQSRIDREDRLTLLYDMLADSDFFDGKRVYFDGYDGFTGQQFKIIDRILSNACGVTFSFPADCGEDPDNGLGVFSNIKATARQIAKMAGSHGVRLAPPVMLDKSHFSSQAITALELNFAGRSNAAHLDATEDVTVVSAENMYDEVRYVACTIRKMVRTEPTLRFRDFVLIARDISSYANLLESTFAKYDIPLFLDCNRLAAALPLMRFVSSAVSAACTLSGEDIFRMLHSGLSPLSDAEIDRLENYAFVWGISGEKWLQPFCMSPSGLSDGRQESADLSNEIMALDELRRRIIDPLQKLRYAAQSRSPKKLVRAIYDCILQMGVVAKLKAITDGFAARGDGETADLYRQSYDAMMKLLGQLELSFDEEEQPAGKTLELLNNLFSALDLGRIPQKLDTVTAGSAEKIRPGRVKYTFVLGMNQGAFPSIKNTGLISQTSRALLNELDVKLDDCRLKSSVDESYLLYKTLFSCYSGLFVSYLRTDNAGRAMEPAAAITTILQALPNCRRLAVGGGQALHPDMLECAEDALSLAAPFWNSGTTAVESVKASLSGTPLESRIRALDHADGRPEPTIQQSTAEKLYGRNMVLSASRIDTFNRCHFSYFCKYGLKLSALKQARIDALQRGTAVHDVLDGLITKYGANYKNTTAEERHREIHFLLQAHKANLLGGVDNEDVLLDYMMRRIEVLLCELSDRLCAEFAQSGFEPTYSELSIGFSEDDPVPPLKIPLEQGSVSIVGSVDRVDTMTYEDRLIFRVIDYKTGERKFCLPDLLYGLNMQMLIYMTAIHRGGIKGIESPTEPAGMLYLRAARSIAGGVDGRDKADKDVRMNGLLVDEDAFLTAMEKEKAGRFIGIRFTKSGTPYKGSNVVSAKDLSYIEERVMWEVRRMGETLLEGDIAAHPVDGTDSAACAYCEFEHICHSKDAAPFKVPTMKIEEAVEKIKEDAENGLSSNT